LKSRLIQILRYWKEGSFEGVKSKQATYGMNG
jgi:hypothetical protein